MSPSLRTAPALSRRSFMSAILGAGLLGAAGGRALVGASRNVIALARPAARGTSATRCGLCGGTDHGMLSNACPGSPKGLFS